MTTPKMQFILVLFISVDDGDGTVSHQDKTALVDALAAQSASTQTMDFMAMGVADLLDLEYLANSLEYIDQVSQNTSTAQTRALTLPQEDENTTVKGSLESLMEGNGSVQLQPPKPAAHQRGKSSCIDLRLFCKSARKGRCTADDHSVCTGRK